MGLPLKILPGLAYAADVSTRHVAMLGRIASEPDYVSCWLTTLINNWQMLGGFADIDVQTLPPGEETATGCDAMIILEAEPPDRYCKVLLIEAKRVKPGMDKHQAGASSAARALFMPPTKPPFSHFSDQLARQSITRMGVDEWVIFEMFQHFKPTSEPGFDDCGSTFVEHDAAFAKAMKMGPKTLWRSHHVEEIASGATINDVIEAMLRCEQGKPFRASVLPHKVRTLRKAVGLRPTPRDRTTVPGFKNLAQLLGLQAIARISGSHSWDNGQELRR